jgi:hypothetical protein
LPCEFHDQRRRDFPGSGCKCGCSDLYYDEHEVLSLGQHNFAIYLYLQVKFHILYQIK